MKRITLIALLIMSLSANANQVTQVCSLAKDEIGISIDDTTVNIGQPIYAHYTADINLHYVFGRANTVEIERNKILNGDREITKAKKTMITDRDRVIIHEDSTLGYGIINQPGVYAIGYRIYIAPRGCDLRANATLRVN